MSSEQSIRVVVDSASTAAALYRLLADGSTWPAWSSLDACISENLDRDGHERVGTVRVNTRGRTVGRDQVTELSPDVRFGYVHLKGLPVRDYRGTVSLASSDHGGTTITWEVRFTPRWPGTGRLLHRAVEAFINDCAEGLAAYPGTPG